MVKKIAMGSIAVTRARKGKDADYYEIDTDTGFFHLNAKGLWDNSVTVKMIHVVGNTRTAVAGNIFVDNQIGWGDTIDVPIEGLVLKANGNIDAQFIANLEQSIEQNADSILLRDTNNRATDVILPIVSDGTNGTSISSANVFFCVSDSNTQQPDDSSFTNDTAKALFIKDNGSKYLWQATKITYSDNKTAVTGKICLGLIDDMQSSIEMYTNTDTIVAIPVVPGHTMAASWTSTPQPQKGKYLWETTRITYANDLNNAKYTTPICIGVFGDDGDAGETPTITTSVLYSSSTKSATQPADSTFIFEKVPALSKGDYLWCRETTTYTYTKNTSLNKSTTRYWVSRVGDDGATGKGIHVAYATDANGKDFSTTWFAAATYIGIYVGTEVNDPTDPKKYAWSRIKGEQGDPGIQGLILRDSIWQEGYEYHNDKDVKTDGIRYLDYVYLKKTTGSGYCVFVCNTTHTSSTSNKPVTKIITNNNKQDEVAVSQGNWTAVNNMGPLYVPLLIAENADFQFGQTNRLLIMNSKNQVQGCFGGVEDEVNGYPLWVGGATAADAKFRVKFDGSAEMRGLKATEANIEGIITAKEGLIGGYLDNNGQWVGGFTIAGDGLTDINKSTSYLKNNMSYIICANDYHGRFAGIGANVQPAGVAFASVGRFENTDLYHESMVTVNNALWLVAKNANYNFAFAGEGNGMLDGSIEGFKFTSYYAVSGGTLPVEQGLRILIYNRVNSIYFPELETMEYLLFGYYNPQSLNKFIAHVEVMAGKGSNFNIFGYIDGKHNDTNLPHFYDQDFNEKTRGMNFDEGDTATYALIYDGSQYMARIMSYT